MTLKSGFISLGMLFEYYLSTNIHHKRDKAMKIDKKLQQKLANQAWIANEVSGGVASTELKVKESKEGVEIILKTASLTDKYYHLEIHNNQLVLYTSYGAGRLEESGNVERPTAIRIFPIANMVNKEEIDAIFDQGQLHIFLPFHEGKEAKRQQIPIKTKYNF